MSADNKSERLRRALRESLATYGAHPLIELERVFKDRSKVLHRGLPKDESLPSLMRVQESISKSLGFHNTHALQQTLSSLDARLRACDPKKRDATVLAMFGTLEALLPLYQLSQTTDDFEIDSVLSPNPVDLEFLASFASRLAQHIPYEQEPLKDAIAKYWLGFHGWEGMISDSEEDHPLVTFEIYGDPSSSTSYGRFELTQEGLRADYSLMHEVIQSVDKDTVLSAEIMRAFYQNLEVFNSCNSMVSAALNMVLLLKHFPDLQNEVDSGELIDATLNLAIKSAEALIPIGFRGKIPYIETENRDYIRVLAQRIYAGMTSADTWQSLLRQSRKMLRLSPGIGFDIQHQHAVFMAVVKGDTPATRLAIRKSMKTDSAVANMASGTALVILGDEAGLAAIADACFLDVDIASFVLEAPSKQPSDYDWMSGYKFEELVTGTMATMGAYRDAEELHRWLSAIVSDPQWRGKVSNVRLSMPSADDGDHYPLVGRWSRWREQCKRESAELARRMLTTYPIPSGKWFE